MKVLIALLLMTTAAMAEENWAVGALPVFGVRLANAPPMVMVAPSSFSPEKTYPFCHRSNAACNYGGHSVTDLDGVTTFYSADMMRVIGTIQITGVVKP